MDLSIYSVSFEFGNYAQNQLKWFGFLSFFLLKYTIYFMKWGSERICVRVYMCGWPNAQIICVSLSHSLSNIHGLFLTRSLSLSKIVLGFFFLLISIRFPSDSIAKLKNIVQFAIGFFCFSIMFYMSVCVYVDLCSCHSMS